MCERRLMQTNETPVVVIPTAPPGFFTMWRACWTLSFAVGLLLTGCSTTPEMKADVVMTESMPVQKKSQPETVKAAVEPPHPSATFQQKSATSAGQESAKPTPTQSPASVIEPSKAAEKPVLAPVQPPVSVNGSSKLISVNFEDADLNVVLRVLGDAAGINFLLGQGVKSTVTMKIEKLPVSEAWSIFQAVLNANSLIAVKEGQIYKILPAPIAQKQPGSINFGRDLPAGEEFYTQIFPLQYLSAAGIVKVFEPLVGQGRVVAHPETNSLILSGQAGMIKEVVQTVKTLDVPGRKKDMPQVFVYYVANAKASELAGVLQTVFTRKRMGPGQSQGQAMATSYDAGLSVPTPPMPGTALQKPGEPTGLSAAGQPDESLVSGDVRIVPDERTNALIIKATPHDYEIVQETIKKLDIVPKQVIIEVLVAEVTLSDSFSLGIEWFIKTGMFAFSQAFGLGAGSGLTATFVDSNDVRAFLTTLSSMTEVNIVTSPHLLARDNKAARIQIGQEVPIVTGTQSTATAVAVGGENVFQTIQQRDIGRILNITPHVTEKRQVTLDINLEISDTLPSSTVKGTPSFSKRSVNSSVVVDDRQSLMLGGIIDRASNHSQSGIPYLRDIPYIGFIFGTTADTNTRSELLILLTPHVVGSPDDGVVETQRFKERLEMLQKEMKMSSGK